VELCSGVLLSRIESSRVEWDRGCPTIGVIHV
jgi:hypothetical protein